jgi:tetratricopeptide (TPR) repeat protein
MFRWRQILLLLLVLGSAQVFAASDDRAFDAAVGVFNLRDWSNAATNFDAFVQKFPESKYVPDAVLYQARAVYQLHQYDNVVTLLSNNLSRAGLRADDFVFLIAQAQFAGGEYSAAADTFAQMLDRFPASLNRLEACIGEAESRAKLEQWPRVIALLQRPDGVFQQQAKGGVTNRFVASGYLVLGEAQSAREDLIGANETLQRLANQRLDANQIWRRDYLKCRIQLGEGRVEDAAQTSTNLLASADAAMKIDFRAESISLQGQIFERLGRTNEALAVYSNNLSTNVPLSQQRMAMLKVTELSLALNKIAEAVQTFENYLEFTNSAAADLAALNLGKLRLREYLANSTDTNLLEKAMQPFDFLLVNYSNSPLVGEAWLNKGWCLWLQTNYVGSLEAFQNAATRLQLPEDQAVARFKWADAQFMLKDFPGAITNYNYIVTHLSSSPVVIEKFLEGALYQTIRVALENRDFDAATNALAKILVSYPNGTNGGNCLLLTAQGFARNGSPDRARKLLAQFEEMYPTNSLATEARLAIARSFEDENNWDAAITNYDALLVNGFNETNRAIAEFYRAWANDKAGRETNAFMLFTNFVALYTNNPLVLQAHWWLAGHSYQQGDFIKAESHYHLIFLNTDWPRSELSYQAEMMAGKAAVSRQKYSDATNYFAKLPGDTNCPVELRLEATLACGEALTMGTEPNWNEAIQWFNSIITKYPTNEAAPFAWGLSANCYLQLGKYDLATNAYQQVISSQQARVQARSQARTGLGTVAEIRAKQETGDRQTQLLREALRHYEDVIFGADLRDGEFPDLNWVKEAGVSAVRVAENLDQWDVAVRICDRIMDSVPELRSIFEGQKKRAREHLANGKNNSLPFDSAASRD